MRDAAALADPTLLARVADLQLIARRVVDGVLSGLHRSPFHGHSAEFSQYRHYQPGDDLKYVDWKLFARTDRLYSKQYRETTNLAACLVIDGSASMSFAGRGPISKHRYGVVMAAVLAHILSGQGDHVGLLARSADTDTYLPARGGSIHRRALFATLGRLQPGGNWSGARLVRQAAQRLRGRGVLMVFSDFYDDDDVMAELRHAGRAGHEVATFQIVTPDELELPYRGLHEFEDLESGARLVSDPGTTGQSYRDAMAAFLERFRNQTHADGIDHSLLLTSQPVGDALRRYLVRQPKSER